MKVYAIDEVVEYHIVLNKEEAQILDTMAFFCYNNLKSFIKEINNNEAVDREPVSLEQKSILKEFFNEINGHFRKLDPIFVTKKDWRK